MAGMQRLTVVALLLFCASAGGFHWPRPADGYPSLQAAFGAGYRTHRRLELLADGAALLEMAADYGRRGEVMKLMSSTLDDTIRRFREAELLAHAWTPGKPIPEYTPMLARRVALQRAYHHVPESVAYAAASYNFELDTTVPMLSPVYGYLFNRDAGRPAGGSPSAPPSAPPAQPPGMPPPGWDADTADIWFAAGSGGVATFGGFEVDFGACEGAYVCDSDFPVYPNTTWHPVYGADYKYPPWPSPPPSPRPDPPPSPPLPPEAGSGEAGSGDTGNLEPLGV